MPDPVTPTASPNVNSTIGLKDVVIAKLTKDDSTGVTYDTLQKVAGAIEATINPGTTDPDIQYADDGEFDVLYPDPELTVTLNMADIPLAIQEMLLGNSIDKNGVLVRNANDTPDYYALGFKSEKTNHKFRYVWLFKCRAKPIQESYGTKEGRTINRKTGSVEFIAIKRTYDGHWEATADEDENSFSGGATFLTSVYTPDFTT